MAEQGDPKLVTSKHWRPGPGDALVLLLVLVHCTQASFSIFGAGKGRGVNLSVGDILVPIAFVVWFTLALFRGRFRLPPLGFPLLGVIWLGLSLLKPFKNGDDIVVSSRGIFDILQFIEYFFIAYLLFANCLVHPKARRWALRLLALAVLISVVAAGFQYYSSASAFKVRGAWYEDRNTFGAFLAMVLPLLFGYAAYGKSGFRKLWTTALIIAALCFCLAGGPYLAICIGLMVVAALKGPTKMIMTGIILLAVTFLLLPSLARPNGSILMDSVAIYSTHDDHQTFSGDVDKVRERLDEKQRTLGRNIAEGRSIGYTDLITEEDHSWKWRQRYKEWQAALRMISRNPIFGVGIGSYQKNINNFYGDMPKYAVNLMEPNTQSMYMVWAASAGIPILIVLLGMVMRAFTTSAKCLQVIESRSDRGAAAGIIGSLAALMVVAIFSDPMVRGLGMTFALILGLSQALWTSHASRKSESR